MKKIFGWVALLVGMVTGANAQVNDVILEVDTKIFYYMDGFHYIVGI